MYSPTVLPRELRQYSNRKLFVTLGAIIGLAFITTAATTVGLSVLLVYRQGAQNYNDSRVELAQLCDSVEIAARLTREYALARDQADLETYRQTTDDLEHRLDGIEAEVTPASIGPTVAKLRPLVEGLISEQGRIFALVQAGNHDEAAAALNSGPEGDLIAQINYQAAAIQQADISQLDADRTRINTLAKTARDVSLASLALTLVLALMVYYLYLKAIQSERRLDKAKDEFVSLASHQLRSPATGVKTILATLVAGDVGELSERQLYFAKKALDSNERGLAVIEELLNVAKADAGRLVLNPTTFDMRQLLENIASEQAGAISQAGLELKIKLPDKPVEVAADHDKLYMAIGNLLDNARKYTPEGGVVTLRLGDRSRDVRVWVSDTGEGIAPGDLPHIFDRFGRGSGATTQNVSGTGLGLYLVRAVVELHGGHVKASSRRRKGTTFAMIIPKRRR